VIRPIFISERHRIMALIDPFAKFKHHVVIAPAEGAPGTIAYFQELDPSRQSQLRYVSDQVGRLIFNRFGSVTGNRELPDRRVVDHTEGFAVPDHPHIVVFSARRTEGARLYGHDPKSERALETYNNTPHELDAMQDSLVFDPDYKLAVEQGLDSLRSVAFYLDGPQHALTHMVTD